MHCPFSPDHFSISLFLRLRPFPLSSATNINADASKDLHFALDEVNHCRCMHLYNWNCLIKQLNHCRCMHLYNWNCSWQNWKMMNAARSRWELEQPLPWLSLDLDQDRELEQPLP